MSGVGVPSATASCPLLRPMRPFPAHIWGRHQCPFHSPTPWQPALHPASMWRPSARSEALRRPRELAPNRLSPRDQQPFGSAYRPRASAAHTTAPSEAGLLSVTEPQVPRIPSVQRGYGITTHASLRLPCYGVGPHASMRLVPDHPRLVGVWPSVRSSRPDWKSLWVRQPAAAELKS